MFKAFINFQEYLLSYLKNICYVIEILDIKINVLIKTPSNSLIFSEPMLQQGTMMVYDLVMRNYG